MPDRTTALPRSVRIVHLPGARNARGEAHQFRTRTEKNERTE